MAASTVFLDDPRNERRQSGQRHANPRRPVGGLVRKLIGGLLDEEEIEQSARGRPVAHGACLPVAAQEGLRRTLAKLRDTMVALRLVYRHGADALAFDRGGAGIVDGTEEAGDVAKGAGLGASSAIEIAGSPSKSMM
jgi:hypothetical protein